MNDQWTSWLESRATVRRRRGLERREMGVRQLPPSIEGLKPLEMASNDFLGLSRHPNVIAAAQDALTFWGAGSGASRLVGGTTGAHERFERTLATFLGAPSALSFSSGYMANLGVISSLATPGSRVILDAHVHASIRDAARLGRAEVIEVDHASVSHGKISQMRDALLEGSSRGQRSVVVVESIYSVLSDAAPLAQIAELCAEFGAFLVVDEAHGIGARGPQGNGLAAEHGLWEIPGLHLALTVTASKALGSQGGAVAGSRALREHLVNTARSFIFDTALSPASAEAATASLRLLASRGGEYARTVRGRAKELARSFGVTEPDGVVVSIPMPSPEVAVRAAQILREQGIFVGCFRPPSVPDGVSRLRVCARYELTDADMERVVREISFVRDEQASLEGA